MDRKSIFKSTPALNGKGSPFSGDIPNFQFSSIDPKKPYFKLMQAADAIHSDPSILETSKGQQLYKQATNAFSQLPKQQQLAMRQQFGQQLFEKGSQLSNAVKKGTIDSANIGAINRSLGKYIQHSSVSPAVKQDIINMASRHPSNTQLQNISGALQQSNQLSNKQWQQLINLGINPPQ